MVASVRARATSTVVVRADGRTIFEGTIPAGRTRRFGADNTLYLYSDSAPDVLVSVNGCTRRSLDSYGCPGCRVAYYTFPRIYYDCR